MPQSKADADQDVAVIPDGTVFLFILRTDAAREWVKENVQTESYQWLGRNLVVEHRYAQNLIDGMKDNGLTVAVEDR